MHWRRKWQPTPVFFPGEPQGRGSLVGPIYGVSQSQTRLKRLSSSSSVGIIFACVPNSGYLGSNFPLLLGPQVVSDQGRLGYLWFVDVMRKVGMCAKQMPRWRALKPQWISFVNIFWLKKKKRCPLWCCRMVFIIVSSRRGSWEVTES